MPEAPPMPTYDYARHEQHPPKRPLAVAVEPASKRLKPTVQSKLESLPAELFCRVLSFVGPTSPSLIALSELNKTMNRTMNAIGSAMLPRARSNFRIPLEPQSPMESCTSLFVRHARTCSQVLTTLMQLREQLSPSHAAIYVANMDKAIDTALHLLDVGPTLSVSLERQILSTCGKCGGMAFKLSKCMVQQSLSHEYSHASSTSLAEQSRRSAQERLDMARLIMQIVVFRDLHISKQSPSNLATLVQHQACMKKTLSMGCF